MSTSQNTDDRGTILELVREDLGQLMQDGLVVPFSGDDGEMRYGLVGIGASTIGGDIMGAKTTTAFVCSNLVIFGEEAGS
jgi:hypothetical protein